MKKIILLILLLFVVTIVKGQDTVNVFYKITDYGKPTMIRYKCVVIDTHGNKDTVCKEMGTGMARGQAGDTVTTEEQELINVVNEIKNADMELNNIPEVIQLRSKIDQLKGIAFYISKKYGIDIEKIKKKVKKE